MSATLSQSETVKVAAYDATNDCETTKEIPRADYERMVKSGLAIRLVH